MRRATTVTALSGFALQGAVLVSGVLAARILGVEGRGYLALLMLFPLGLSLLTGLGLPLSVTYHVSRQPGIAASLARSLAPLAGLQVALTVTTHACLAAIAFWGAPRSVQISAAVTLVAGPGMLAQQYGLSFFQARDQWSQFNGLRLLPFALYAVGTIAIFVAGSGDLILVSVVFAGAFAVAGTVSLTGALRTLPEPDEGPVPSRSELLRFGARGVIGWASPVETFRLDQAVAGLALSPRALGLYVAGLAFTNLPRLVAQSVGMVAYPRVAAHREPARASETMWRFFWINAASTVLLVLALWFALPPLLPLFFGAEFSSAVPVGRILLIAAVFASLRRVLTDGVRGRGRPGLGTTAEIVSWAILLPALTIFTSLWKIEGVALALVLSSAASFGLLLLGVLRGERDGSTAPAPRCA